MALWLVCLILGSSIFLMRYCPDTPLGVALRRYLAVEPVRWLAERRRSDVFYFVLLAGLAIGGGEVFAVLGPETVLMYSADLAVYLDLVVFSSLAAVGARLRGTYHAMRGYALSIRARAGRSTRRKPREVITRRKGTAASADNDDEDSPLGDLLTA
jgi:hypothetical protein